ncbi:DEAD/DEAH box helicase [Candidatus Micrarchaeota archaeon]|jgi:Fanconi anemia group M protein|nr:DEAD/DEAH box helicase [Candidatus Micrarchaeota archaeon]
MLKDIKPREYQKNIAESALKKGNTLVILPTGLGKTLIALIMIDKLNTKGNILFMAPTRPLAEQHYKSITEKLDMNTEEIILINGSIKPKEREELWKKPVCICTPQTAKNDIENKRLDLTKYSLCIIDEAHRSVGNYAYTFVAENAIENKVKIIGMTASPGGDKKRIKEIMDALYITNIEARTHEDEDVEQYVKKTNISWEFVELGEEIKNSIRYLKEMYKEYLETLKKFGIYIRIPSKVELIKAQRKIQNIETNSKYAAMSFYSSIFNLAHAIELLETQGVVAFNSYVYKMRYEKTSKGVERVLRDHRFKIAENLIKNKEHPKVPKLVEILKQNNGTAIVFAQYRDQVQYLVKRLNTENIKAKEFMGQKKGFTQKDQKRIIEEFKNKEFQVLCCTSVGEEGLDLPSVDLVIFYESTPSAIRSIQRRGRTGRHKEGKVIILITKNTQDEIFYWASKKKEKKMKQIISEMSNKTSYAPKLETKKQKKKQASILDF